MKYLSESEMKDLDAGRIAAGSAFAFRCHDQLACFNRCCHNLNLFLYHLLASGSVKKSSGLRHGPPLRAL